MKNNIFSSERQEMDLDRYEFNISKRLSDYEFISEGPKGRIKKVVRFNFMTSNIYNLTFGDLNENTGKINDKIVTNKLFEQDFTKDFVNCGSSTDLVTLRSSDGDTADSNCETIDDGDG